MALAQATALGGVRTSGAAEATTLGYDLPRPGGMIEAMPLLEVTDMPVNRAAARAAPLGDGVV